MLENVPGLAADHRLEAFSARLARLGYRSAWRVLDASDYGIPQRRKRLIYIALRDGARIREVAGTQENRS
jgi:DNA (cytosine-5)-methyltransferase 1